MARLPLASVTPRPTPGPRGGLRPAVLGLALAAGIAGNALAQVPSFTILSVPPGGSNAFGVSADGQSVVGYTTSRGAYVWRMGVGREDFEHDGDFRADPTAISGDGATVVGQGSRGSVGYQAFRWSGLGTFQLLGTLGNYAESQANGVSGDGSVVVGLAQDSTGNFGQAFRWTSSGGMQGLGYVRPGSTYSTATAVSRDGSTIVGRSRLGGHTDAYRWTESAGIVALPWLNSLDGSEAFAVNFNGSVIVGDAGSHAAMWRNGQIIDLGMPLGWNGARAQAVSDDGNVVAGLGYSAAGQRACVWTPTTGMIPLADYLAANGVVLPTGWVLADCTGISADGRTFVGQAWTTTEAQGFIATIPSPGPLAVGLAALCSVARRRRPQD